MQSIIQKIGEHKGALPMSWSRISSLLICPRQFDLRYREKAAVTSPPVDPSAAEAGKLIHKVLELAVERCAGQYSYANSKYEALWTMLCNSTACEETKARMEKLREPTAQVLARLLAIASKHGAKALVEEQLVIDRLGNSVSGCHWNRMAWQGYTDLILRTDTKCIIVDYKSEHYTEERQEKTAMQTALYAYALFLRHPELQNVQTCAAYLLDARIETEDRYTRDEMPHIEELVRSLLSEYLTKLESGDKNPVLSQYCKWCSYSDSCPVFHGSCWDKEL